MCLTRTDLLLRHDSLSQLGQATDVGHKRRKHARGALLSFGIITLDALKSGSRGTLVPVCLNSIGVMVAQCIEAAVTDDEIVEAEIIG